MNPRRYSGMLLCVFGMLFIYALSFSYSRQAGSPLEISGFKFVKDVVRVADIHEISPALVTAIIHAESNFNPKARSYAGAKGLMQINAPTQRYLKLKNVYDPIQNIEAGTRYLRELFDIFGGNLVLAIAAYNAGPGAVKRWSGVPPYSETKSYIKKVLAYYDQYRKSLFSDSLMS